MRRADAVLPWARTGVARDLVNRACDQLGPTVSASPVGWTGHHDWKLEVHLERWPTELWPDAELLLDLGEGVQLGSVRATNALPIEPDSADSAEAADAVAAERTSGVLALQLEEGPHEGVHLTLHSVNYAGGPVRVGCRATFPPSPPKPQPRLPPRPRRMP